MCTGLSALPELNSPPCVRTLPACLPTIGAPAAQDRPGGGRKQEDRKCHPYFTDLWSLKDHRAACFISQIEKAKPKGGKHLELRPRNLGSETRWCAQRATDKEENPVRLSRPGSKSHTAPFGPLQALWGCLAGLRGTGVGGGQSG